MFCKDTFKPFLLDLAQTGRKTIPRNVIIFVRNNIYIVVLGTVRWQEEIKRTLLAGRK